MTAPTWKVEGRYYENCSCDFLCPCILGQMSVKPTKGWCTFAMGFRIEKGRYGEVPLDGLGFVVVGHTPEEMAKGGWSVGVVVDQLASAQQKDAIAAIASGSAGGPMAALGGLVANFHGVETAPIAFDDDGVRWSVEAGDKVRIEGTGVPGLAPDRGPLSLGNTGHPAADTFNLARTSNSRVSALGIAWTEASGRNNAQYAPFAWSNA